MPSKSFLARMATGCWRRAVLLANVFLYLNDKFQHFEDVAKIHSSDNKIDSQSLAVTIQYMFYFWLISTRDLFLFCMMIVFSYNDRHNTNNYRSTSDNMKTESRWSSFIKSFYSQTNPIDGASMPDMFDVESGFVRLHWNCETMLWRQTPLLYKINYFHGCHENSKKCYR